VRAPWRAAAALALLAAAGAPAACSRTPPAGVILISIDTLRRDRLNCYGYRARAVSPHVDALAAGSVLFESAVAASPWTTPSHMTLLTSLAPSSHGVLTPFQRLLRDVREGSVERLPAARLTLAEVLSARGFDTAAFTGGVTLDPAIGFGQGFDTYDTSLFKMDAAAMARMQAWLEARRQRPFFLFWHTFEAHAPYLQTRFLREAVPADVAAEAESALGELGRHFMHDPTPPGVYERLEALKPHHRQLAGALYDGGVSSADRWLGELVAFLRARGMYERVLIVFTADHGEELWDRGSGGIFGLHGHSLYEEMTGVPLIVKLPGGARAGTRVALPAPAVDVMPTVLDVLGIPASAAPEMEGRSLRALWEGRETGGRLAFSEALAFEEEQKSVRTDRYKYILTVPPGDVEAHGRRYLPPAAAGQLYDLQRDPREERNLLPVAARVPAAATSATAPPSSGPASLVDALDVRLRQYVATHTGTSEKGTVAADTVERLRALGYVR
jgi:arylsulfatase A-like enzyme